MKKGETVGKESLGRKKDGVNYRNSALKWVNSITDIVEIKDTLPFTIASKRIKYIGINLPRETKDQYVESYDTGERS